MDNRGKISRKIKHYGCLLRSLGAIFFIPILVNDILIPVLVAMSYMHYGADEHTFTTIVDNVQVFSPFLSTLWIYIHLIKYIDAKGNEMFYLCDRIKAKEILFLYLFYTVTNTLPFFWYVRLYAELGWEWLHLAIVFFFMAGLAYFMSYLFKSIALAIIPALCYAFLAVAGNGSKPAVWSFYEGNGMPPAMLGTKYVWFVVVGVLFFAAGLALNKIYTDY
jgi:hypothetical protein